MSLLEFTTEYGIREPRLVSNTGCEGNISVVQVGRAPGKGPGVKSHEEDSVPIRFGAAKELKVVRSSGLDGGL